MIATPHSYVEIGRSGTWATVRYARKAGKPIYLILPDGLLGS
jgi:predicted Rossmann fold nucleotide-binding protein DprA/Smf involved in DNA uptake